MNIEKGRDIRLNVRPVFFDFIHDYVYEGPCRFGKGDELKPEFDKRLNEGIYNQFIQDIQQHMPGGVNILEPIRVTGRSDDFRVIEKDLRASLKGQEETDFYFLGEGGRSAETLIEFGKLCKKPLACMTVSVGRFDISAALRSRGLEAYCFPTWEDAAYQMRLLRVQKVLANTRVLLVNRFGGNVSYVSSIASCIDLEGVTDRLKMRFRYLNAHEFLDQIRPREADANPTTPGRVEQNITPSEKETVDALTNALMSDAKECDMERDHVWSSMRVYYTVKKLLAHHDCNAFAIPCADLCATRRLNEEQCTFCMTHSLLEEDCIPSACEYDVSMVISKVILSNLADKATYMGNNTPVLDAGGQLGNVEISRFVSQEEYDSLKDIPNLMVLFHSVPNRKLKGYDQPAEEYSVRSYAYSGWGVTLRYDFNKDVGRDITLLNVNPEANKLFVAKGEIKGGMGYHHQNCSVGVFYQVRDSKDFARKQMNFGSHFTMAYGNYVEDIKALGDSLGMEVVVA